ncbi:MAG: PspA/IM30 family protein [Chloroflexi bacterium]|nr:PspA/IM30 family protein [Chloroflexota bacterium]
MGLMARITSMLKAKLSRFLESAEDPRETLDYSYQKQLELLRNVKRGVVEVVTSRRRLELQAVKLQENASRLDGQARQALAAGREDLARLALQRKQEILLQLQGLDAQIGDLEKEQEKLAGAEARLSTKVESFRTRKEVIKAQYSAAEAQVKIGEAVTGLSEEFADVGMAVERAEDKVEQLRARSTAIDELVAAGTLEDFTVGKDVIEQELAKTALTAGVEQELAAMKIELAAPQPPKQLEEGR